MNPWQWWRHTLSPFTTTVSLAEDCPCGASTTIEGVSLQEATTHLTSWRSGHRHETPVEAELVGTVGGAVSQAELAPFGFTGGDCA